MYMVNPLQIDTTVPFVNVYHQECILKLLWRQRKFVFHESLSSLKCLEEKYSFVLFFLFGVDFVGMPQGTFLRLRVVV